MNVWKVETVKSAKQLEKALNIFQKNGWTVINVVCDPLSGAKSHFSNRGRERYTIIANRFIEQ